MNIQDATQSYEAWLGGHIKLLPLDLEQKHRLMAENIFAFLRATFYRWLQLWPRACPECVKAPRALAVGDLHVENFGTWRDVEGRLVWGINDFDEASSLPYTLDLARLAASAHLAIRGSKMQLGPRDACTALLAGYRKALASGGRPFVLDEDHPWLYRMVTSALRDPKRYWDRLDALSSIEGVLPKGARRAIEKMMPGKNLAYRTIHRRAGLGSLGRERYMALAEFAGGRIAREAKALAPSACHWAAETKAEPIRYQEIVDSAVRAPDPFLRLKGRWIVRRLGPHCSRVELSAMPRERDETKLLRCMGFETANVHLGTPKAARAILKDLDTRPEHWLHDAAEKMVKATASDWEDWKKPQGLVQKVVQKVVQK